ncbi:hypothetical protein GCM10009846_00020 [Agrococcus versicolor]|uniref:DUF5979 domain-containing protein n=1 Tax=Agrococcus versicolor TaxID=501482 RepID=A0ABP5M843_9MICO
MTLIAAPAAVAAPPYASNGTIDSLTFVQSTVQSGSEAQIEGTWSLPDNAPSPAGFVVPLPAALQGLTDAFPLLDPQNAVMGQCTVTATQLYCDIDPAYLAANPLNVDGTFRFFVAVRTEVTESTQVSYDFGGVVTTVTVTPASGTCPECVFDGRDSYKYGDYEVSDDSIRWTVNVAAPAGGMPGDQTVTVVDRLGPNQQQQTEGTGFDVHVDGTNQFDAGGFPTGFQRVDGLVGLQVSIDGNGDTVATFQTQQGWVYNVVFFVDTTNAGNSFSYSNAADLTIAGSTETLSNDVRSQGGGATGDGDDVGRFSITKDVVWNGGAPVPGIAFTGTYTATDPEGVVTQGTFSVAEDGTWTSPDLLTGSIVSIDEILPTTPSNVTWGAPALSIDDFAIVGAAVTPVTLTNTATLQTGTFTASKVVTGSGASLVSGDTTFTLQYSYPAGTGYAAGSGSLTLRADGTVATSAPLPVGAVLTLSEAAPATIANASWGTPVISPSTVTIGQGGAVAVTVTNTITLGTGTFSASKLVTGDGAGAVPASATFTLDYAYPAGAGFAAGSGSLTLPADGTVVTSPALPIGAVVTLTEATPAPVANATWRTPVLSTSTVTIGAAAAATVTVTNELALDRDTFSASKILTGDGADAVPDDATFQLDYAYPAGPGFAAGSGSLTLPADGTVVTSPALPVGAVVTLVEATPAPIEDAAWSAPVLSASTLTIGSAASDVTVTVTNELTLGAGVFSAEKVLVGDGAALVPSDATFALDYSYPAGPGYEAGSGTLRLPANGDAVTSPALPEGAVVTLSEAAPAAVHGATWAGSELSTTTLTIGSEEAAEVVVVTNTITAVPVIPSAPAPSEPASSVAGQTGGLPRTGGDLALGALALAGALVAAGAVLTWRRRTASA